MDKETENKMNEAMNKAEEARRFMELAGDSNNKEFWENNLKTLENNKKIFQSNLAETEFLIECYKNKIETFK